MLGDGSKDPVTITGDTLSEFKTLLEKGGEYMGGKEMNNIEKVFSFFWERVV